MKNNFLLYLPLFVLVFQNLNAQLPDTIDQDYYYSSDIFSSGYQRIYNNWVLTRISGGEDGSGYTPDFDNLVITQYGIFKIFRNDSLMCYGKITVEGTDQNGFLISLVEDTCTGGVQFWDMEKYVSFGNNTLTLRAPCCDRYNYHFVSCESLINSGLQTNPEVEEIRISSDTLDFTNILSIWFINKDIGFASFSDGNILKTYNGGKSWHIKTSHTDLPLKKLFFINDSIGFAAGGKSSCSGIGCGSVVLKTTNAGETWQKLNIPDKTWSELRDIHFVNPQKGFAVGLGLAIKTENGGNTWEEFDINFNGIVSDIDFLNDTIGFACGIGGNFSKTIDGGETWVNMSLGTSFLNCVKFINEDVGFISQQYLNMLKTEDGGQTWNPIESSPVNVNHISILNNKIIATGAKNYTSGDCTLWYSNFNVSENNGLGWKGDHRLSQYFQSFCTAGPYGYVGISGNIILSVLLEDELYKPLVQEANHWNIVSASIGPNLKILDASTTQFRISGDTIINGTTYKIVYSCHDSICQSWNAFGFMREDPVNKKIWFRNFGHEEGLIYDFNVYPGSIITLFNPVHHQTGNYEVISIDSVLIESTYHRAYFFGEDSRDEVWIEGIGSNYGIFNGNRQISGGFTELLCFSNNSANYVNPKYNTCYKTAFTPEIICDALDTAYISRDYYFQIQTTAISQWDSVTFLDAIPGSTGDPQLPDGLVLDQQTGVISGIPLQQGIFPMCIYVWNHGHVTDYLNVDLVVENYTNTAPDMIKSKHYYLSLSGNYLVVESSAIEGDMVILIHDASGKLLANRTIDENNKKADIGELSNGLYIVTAISRKTKTILFSDKLVNNK